MKAIHESINEEKGFSAFVFKENDGCYRFRTVFRKDGDVVKISLFVEKHLAIARADQFAQSHDQGEER
jgi:hypothetical protein